MSAIETLREHPIPVNLTRAAGYRLAVLRALNAAGTPARLLFFFWGPRRSTYLPIGSIIAESM